MKRTYQPNNRKKAKKHGFFARIKGKVLNSRRAKKEKNYVHNHFLLWFFLYIEGERLKKT